MIAAAQTNYKDVGDVDVVKMRGLHWVGPYMRIVLCPVPVEYLDQLHGAPNMDVECIKYPPEPLDEHGIKEYGLSIARFQDRKKIFQILSALMRKCEAVENKSRQAGRLVLDWG
ncbi:hypothetical protein HK104_001041 [Borealophlyctis nickersoniae]|nr:hypothetical protein HK104_001041 [Borealophlyctis nickersoniae]